MHYLGADLEPAHAVTVEKHQMVSYADTTAAVPFVALGLMFAGAHVYRLFGG